MSQAKNSNRNKKQLESFVERLKQAIGTESIAAFAKRAKVTDSLLRAYLRGESQPGLDRLIAMAETADVRVEWLITGEPPIKRDPGVKDMLAHMMTIRDAFALSRRLPEYANAVEQGVIPEDAPLDEILAGKWDTEVAELKGRTPGRDERPQPTTSGTPEQEIDFELLAKMFRLAEQGIRDLGYTGEIHERRIGAIVANYYRFLQWKYDSRQDRLKHAGDTREWVKAMKDMLDFKNLAKEPDIPGM